MIPLIDLTNQTVVVTGASSGLGRAVCIQLSKVGARIVATGRDSERLDETIQQCEGEGHLKEVLELTAGTDLSSWMSGITKQVGPLSGLVHAAGTHVLKPLRALQLSDIQSTAVLNLEVPLMLLKAFRQRHVRAPAASVVLFSSVMGLVGDAGTTAYAAAKGAVIAMTRSAALELAREQIRVNCLAPGYVVTEMAEKLRCSMTEDQFSHLLKLHPLGLGRPEDAANAVAFLLSTASRWITGTTLVLDGGYTAQ